MGGLMTVKFTILGCGSSSGVPRITGDWGVCDPAEPKNHRLRCAMLLEKTAANGGITRVLIDSGADIRCQLIAAKTPMLDAVLLTHEHADHTHGIDDLRSFAQDGRQQVPVYMTKNVFSDVGQKFSYCFKQVKGSFYPAILKYIEINYDNPIKITGAGGKIEILPVKLTHGDIDVAGFLINGVMYTPDISDIPQQSLYAFENLNIWIIDALRITPHPSHFNLDKALEWINIIRPKKAILTDMSGALDYRSIKTDLSKLNQNIIPAYDGMSFKI